jgi:predicted enzyme related to lactoylglutathione lyase
VPLRDEAPVGAPCWVDVLSSDPVRTQDFYGRLFGWTVEDPGEEHGGYFNFLKDGVHVAGGMRNDGASGVPDLWSVYLATDDADGVVARTVSAGGEIMVPAMDVMALGRMAVMTDVGGAVIGTWQAGLHRGFGVLGEPGAPAWFELHTRAYDATLDFYRTVFDWKTEVASDEPDFRYTTLDVAGEQLAGVMDASGFLPEGVPPSWTVYFAVQDADAALSEVVALGGEVVMGAENTPYGRLATAADATGALFRLIAG